MAENDTNDQEDKTEDPSHKRLEDAKKKGQAPFSREIVSWFFTLGCAVVLLLILPMVASHITKSLRFFISSPHDIKLQEHGLSLVSLYLAKEITPFLAIPLILICIILILSGVLQLRDSISASSLKPKMSRLSLKQGIQKIVSKKAVIEFIKTVIKTIIIFYLIYYMFKDISDEVPAWSELTLRAAFSIGERLILRMFVVLLIFMFFLSIFDYGYQRFEFMKSLRMTKQEQKDEYKEMEGDPAIKQRIRKIRMDRVRNKMMQNVPNATVIVTNPTHYSVALSFNEETLMAPRLVAKGTDHMALLIREVGKKNQVPIVENPAVARDLYARVELNQEIPEDTYKAVAEIIKFVLNLKKQQF